MIKTLASFALLLALASSARAGTLLTLKNIELSVYYDNSEVPGQLGPCGKLLGGGSPNWQDDVLRDKGSCGGISMLEAKNNRMIALPAIVDPKQYCGRKVRITDAQGKVLTVEGKDYFYVKDTLPSANNRVDVSGAAIREYTGKACQVEVSPGSFQDLKGATVDVLDEMDPEGMLTVGPTDPSPPSGNNPPPPGGNPPSPPPTNPPNSPAPKDPPQGNVPTAECPCTYEQLNQHGCCNGVAAICNWISNEPKLLAFVAVPDPSVTCPKRRARFDD
ncbi:hypothetical protein DB88DRAFT_278089 [Papiliotrema laurentii]|uniref:RlpA-like protein double-psi beta-barrel domain-containing protein n=1 Tax=Papiliotrema laurentii TaxID=5418 RepID=A0AAD9FPV1_PAPLA|nr:hypothetical protein DB88DRAFT_278089 [Papiliotrema laurentii]